jgi:hypothetical protein
MTLEVPNDPQYIASLAGALWELQFWWNWERNNAHTARAVTAVWRKLIQEAFDRINAGQMCPVPSFVNIAEMEYEMSICEQLRFHDGKFQGLCCGKWTDIPGQEGFVFGGPGQQGGGTPQPEPGACQTYHAQFTAKDTYLLPTVVNAGDVLTFSNADGSGSDGSFFGGFTCPDGGTFFAGGCLPIYDTDGADPNPAISHMALIAKIGAVYYPAFDGVVTVPGGIVNEQVFILTNDSTRDDNNGSYSLDVEVCNNTVAAWSHILDLTLSPNGLTLFHPGDCVGGTGYGTWVAGSGFVVGNCDNGAGTFVRAARFEVDFAATTITSMFMTSDSTVGANGSAGTLVARLLAINSGGSGVSYAATPTPVGTGLVTGANTPMTIYGIGISLDVDYEPTMGALGGSGRVYRLAVSGTGFDPFA